jgi:hypothetical protein
MQVSLALVGLLSSISAWLSGATVWWLTGGILLAAVMPFTVLVILPTNKQLLAAPPDRPLVETERLLVRWGRLHAVRSVLSATALLLFLYLVIVGRID